MRSGTCIALAIGAVVISSAANAATVSYGVGGTTYQEAFDVLSSSAAPTTGYGWQQGPATSNNTGLNSPTGTAGIAGTYVFSSGVAGSTPDLSLGGPRNFAGPDGIAASSWQGAANYFSSGNTGSRLYSFGIAGTNAVSERALGFVSGSTANTGSNGTIPGDAYLAIVLQNTTGQALSKFTLTYDGEKWRDGAITAASQGLLFSYKTTSSFSGANTDVVTTVTASGSPAGTFVPGDASSNNNGFGDFTRLSALDYTPGTTSTGGLAAVDGNAAANRTADISATESLTWAPGDYLILRWFDNDENGTDLGLALDNLRFSAVGVPEPTSLVALGAAGMMLRRRRRH